MHVCLSVCCMLFHNSGTIRDNETKLWLVQYLHGSQISVIAQIIQVTRIIGNPITF